LRFVEVLIVFATALLVSSCGGNSTDFNNPSDFVVSIPDTALENAIRAEIGKDTGAIYESDLKKIVSLDASGRGITNLTGLSHCKNLTGALNLNDNEISSVLQLSGVTNVTELYLQNNQLSGIYPLGPLQKIAKIDLDSNQIDDFASLSGMMGMTKLSINANELDDLNPISVMIHLEILLAADNDISSLTPLKSLMSLRIVDLRNNRIEDLGPLLENPYLGAGAEIRLSGNPLSQDAVDSQVPELQSRGVKIVL